MLAPQNSSRKRRGYDQLGTDSFHVRDNEKTRGNRRGARHSVPTESNTVRSCVPAASNRNQLGGIRIQPAKAKLPCRTAPEYFGLPALGSKSWSFLANARR